MEASNFNTANVDHKKFMGRAVSIAQKGLGYAAPNPMVGAVLVHQNRIIGEGWHERYGEGHAEVNAIASVKKENLSLLPHSTMYVTLEPCAHYGKTPPCAELLVKHQIKRVVIGYLDPTPKVYKQGIAILETAGIEVLTGIEAEKCRKVACRFLTFHQQNRPYIILKWAETADGFFAPKTDKQQWISNGIAKRLSHRWRAEEAAILVGRKTAEIDNPQLTPRLWKGKNPLRLVIDRNLQLKEKNLHLFDQSTPTVVFTSKKADSLQNLIFQNLDFSNKNIVAQILQYLHEQKINSLIVEGGKQILQSFIDLGLWDEARIFVGNSYWGEGISAPILKSIESIQNERIGDNTLKVIYR
ncbi:MAG: bifunctional diaminohydroxyphosphoribosylaminopyrimidine deaminase/5-amino-6-(5-phosphoribosylamino)uracil reductase RibD, partial [Chitinophagales bacterium]